MNNWKEIIWNWTIKLCSPIVSFLLIRWVFTDHFFVFALDPIRQWIAFGALMIFIPFFIYHSINIWGKSETIHAIAISIASLSVLIIGPVWAYTSNKTELDIYTKDGVKTYGVVVKNWIEDSNIEKTLKYKFSVNSKEYLSYNERNFDNKYDIGDTVQIMFNKKNPEMNCLVEKLATLKD